MGFYIKSVEATGPKVKKATINLTNGLNIIAGISNKGKTTILQFIEYAFGGLSKDSDISISPSQTGYNLVKVTLNVNLCRSGSRTVYRSLLLVWRMVPDSDVVRPAHCRSELRLFLMGRQRASCRLCAYSTSPSRL